MYLANHLHIERFIRASDITGNKKYYLYVHIRIDRDEPFYIGIGTKYRKNDYDRAMCCNKRSLFWKRISNKTKHNVLIISESDNKQEILDKEINYIKILGRRKTKSGTLVNITEGGEGLKGHKIVWTEEMRNKIREANKNRKISEYTREKHRREIRNKSFFGKINHSKPILQLDSNTNEIIREFSSSAEAARFYNVKSQSINRAARTGTKSVNFKWIYKNGSTEKGPSD